MSEHGRRAPGRNSRNGARPMTGTEPPTTVACIRPGCEDRHGVKIEEVYQRKDGEYAVYRTEHRVAVQFSDTQETAVKQRRALAPLLPLRDEIDGLLQGWRDADSRDPKSRGFFGLRDPKRLNAKVRCQDRRVGGALVQAMEDDLPGAQLLLEKIKSDILNERIATARSEYLMTALVTGLGIMFLAWLLASLLPLAEPPGGNTGRLAGVDTNHLTQVGVILLLIVALVGTGLATAGRSTPPLRAGLVAGVIAIIIVALLIIPGTSVALVDKYYSAGVQMWRGVAAGAVGAYFSIALAIRGRTVLPDLLRSANMLDAVLRVTVGAIGGAVLVALVVSGVVTFSLINPTAPLFALIAGFFAGFAERLVPDLLAKVGEKPVEFDAQQAAARAQREARIEREAEAVRKEAAKVAAAPSGAAAMGNAEAEAVNDNLPDDDVEVGPEGFRLEDDEATQDEELPAAVGGVAKP